MGVPIFAQKHRLWVLVRTASAVLTCTHNLCFEQNKKNIKAENFLQFLKLEKSLFIAWASFCNDYNVCAGVKEESNTNGL